MRGLLSRVTYPPRVIVYLWAILMFILLLFMLSLGLAYATQTPIVSGSAVSGVVVSASQASLRGAYAYCSSNCFMMIFNSATVPANESTTAGAPNVSGAMVHCIGPAAQPSISYDYRDLEFFTVGISIAISSTGCGTLTLSTVGFIHAVAQ